MKTVDTTELRGAMRSLAISLHQKGETSPHEFITSFHEQHAPLVNKFAVFGFDQYILNEGRRIMKKVGEEIAAVEHEDQDDLPGIFEGMAIPKMMPLTRNVDGVVTHIWVARREGRIQDGDDYRDLLQANVNACMANLVDFTGYWKVVRGVLETHPRWTIGKAEDAIRKDPDKWAGNGDG